MSSFACRLDAFILEASMHHRCIHKMHSYTSGDQAFLVQRVDWHRIASAACGVVAFSQVPARYRAHVHLRSPGRPSGVARRSCVFRASPRAARVGGRGSRPHRPVTLPARSCLNRTLANLLRQARRSLRDCGVNPACFTRARAVRRARGSRAVAQA